MPEFGKTWVRVHFREAKSTFVPSFEDLYCIVRPIAEVEEDKYPNGKGRWMVAEFLKDACSGLSYETLVAKYKIPKRGT